MPDLNDPDYDIDRIKREEEKLLELERAERELQVNEQEQIVKKDILAWAEKKEKRLEKVKKDLEKMDGQLKTGLSLILSEYAETYQFNQPLLEDLVPIIVQRAKMLRKIK